ncbi:MAG: hypothetical protein KBC92_15080 [Giesbergeria sp.]|nr:hypothetical protein [Giesbergeria sp.]
MSRTPTYTDPTDRKLPHPGEIIAPGCGDPALLTRSPIRSIASAADLAPPAQRPGAQDVLVGVLIAQQLGDRLHYRDGRVTDLQGNPIKTQGAPE